MSRANTPTPKSPSIRRIFSRPGRSENEGSPSPNATYPGRESRETQSRTKPPASDTIVFRSGARPLEDLAKEMDDGVVLQEDAPLILTLIDDILEKLDLNITRMNEFKEVFLSALNKHPSEELILEIQFLAQQIEKTMQTLQPYNCGRFYFSLDKSIAELKGRPKVERLVTAGTVGINYSLKILFGLKSGLNNLLGKRSQKFFSTLKKTLINLTQLTSEKHQVKAEEVGGELDEDSFEKLRQQSEFIRGATERIFFKLTEYRRNILSCLNRGPNHETVVLIETLHKDLFSLFPILSNHMESRFSRALSAIGVESAPTEEEDGKRRLELFVTACAVALTHLSRTLVNIKNEASTTKSVQISETYMKTLDAVLKGVKLTSPLGEEGLMVSSSYFSVASVASLPTARMETKPSMLSLTNFPSITTSPSFTIPSSPLTTSPSFVLPPPDAYTCDFIKEKVKKCLTPGTIEDHYIVGKQIGSGAYGVVKEVTHKETGQARAVKVINIKGQPPEFVQSVEMETGILSIIKHKYLVSLRDFFVTPTEYQIVMDLIPGGELFDRIVEVSLFPEKESRRLVKQILEVVDYLHNFGIVHRDLKPENILLKSRSPDTDLVIMDFGCAKLLNEGAFKDAVGTLMYSAPEALTALRSGGTYSKEVDIWSTGCIMYILLCGFPPFYDDDDLGIAEEIINARYTFPSPEWDEISPEAKDLLRSMFKTDPCARTSAKEALAHPWFSLSL